MGDDDDDVRSAGANRQLGRRLAAVAVTIGHALAVILGGAGVMLGCNSSPVTDLRHELPRIAVMPIHNLSGADLAAVPTVLWERADTVRMLARLEQSAAPLARLPFPDDELPFESRNVPPMSPLRAQLSYDAPNRQLIWREQMTEEDRDELLDWSDAPEWHYAVRELFATSVGDRLDAHDLLRRQLVQELQRLEFEAIDAEAAGIQRTTTATERWSATHSRTAPPTYREKLRAVAMTTRASAVLMVAVEEWDWTHAFETNEIVISMTAVLADPTDGRLLWQRSTGPIRCKLPDGLRLGSSLDLRQVYPQFTAQIIRKLLA